MHSVIRRCGNGTIAEKIVFGDVSTGAQDDLQKATDLARDMVSRYGMSEAIGLAAFERPRNAMFLDVPLANPQEYNTPKICRVVLRAQRPRPRHHS